MTVLAYILSYLFIGLICCIIVTYFDTKYNWSNNRYRGTNDNVLPVVAFIAWPIAVPILLITLLCFGLDSTINKLRELFDE